MPTTKPRPLQKKPDIDFFPELHKRWEKNPEGLESSLKRVMKREKYLNPMTAMIHLETRLRKPPKKTF